MTDHSPSARLGWIERLPVGWEPRRIKHGTYVKGRIGWHGLKSTDFRDTGAYLVTGTDFLLGKLDWSRMRRVDESFYLRDPYIQLRIGDLLLTKDGTIGKVAVVDDLPGPATLNSGLFVIRPEGRTFDNRFMYWVLSSRLLADFIDYRGMGTTITHLYQGTFLEMPYPRPPLEAQRRIADFLDRETARIDELVDKKIRLIELLEEKRSVLISQAATRGLYSSAATRESGSKWFGLVPAHWDVGVLKRWWDVVDCKHRTAQYVDEGVPLVGTVQVRPGRLSLEGAKQTTVEEYADLIDGGRKPSRGDIIYSRNASLGAAAYVDTDERFCMGQDVCMIRSGVQSQLYLSYLLSSAPVLAQVDSQVVGATFKRINVDQIRSCEVLRPPVDEQRRIARYLDSVTETIDRSVMLIQQQVGLVRERRQILVTAVVTGQIDVAAQPSEPGEAVA